MPDDIANVVRDEQRTSPVDRHAYGAAKSIALGIDKLGEYVLGRPDRASIGKRDEYDFVAASRFAIPRAVLADKRPASIVPRQQTAAIEHQSEWDDVVAECVVGSDGADNQIRTRGCTRTSTCWP